MLCIARHSKAEFSAGPMKEALGWAKSAIASKEGEPQTHEEAGRRDVLQSCGT